MSCLAAGLSGDSSTWSPRLAILSRGKFAPRELVLYLSNFVVNSSRTRVSFPCSFSFFFFFNEALLCFNLYRWRRKEKSSSHRWRVRTRDAIIRDMTRDRNNSSKLTYVLRAGIKIKVKFYYLYIISPAITRSSSFLFLVHLLEQSCRSSFSSIHFFVSFLSKRSTQSSIHEERREKRS